MRPGLKLCSHCIMSKKMGMVAFRSSGSGTRVTSRMGPTMAGMNFILWGPEGPTECRYHAGKEKKNPKTYISKCDLRKKAISFASASETKRTNLITLQTENSSAPRPDA